MCDRCARENIGDSFDPRDPNLSVENIFGVPVIHTTRDVGDGDGHAHVIGIPVDFNLPPHVKAENERRINEMMDAVDSHVAKMGEDATWVAISMTLANEMGGDPREARGSAMVTATAVTEAARLRREVRAMSEGLFGPQARSQTPQTGQREEGWNPPPPWA